MTSLDSSTPKRMLHLSLEVSTPAGGMALWESGSELWSARWERGTSHSEVVTAKLAEGLKEAQISAQDLSFVAVTRGPGSFTGLRVGINIAKTLGMSLSIPIVAVTTLELLAAEALRGEPPHPDRLLVALNAFKGMVYWCAFKRNGREFAPEGAPQAHTWKDLAGLLDGEATYAFLGDGFLPLERSVPEDLKARLDFRFGQSLQPSAITLGPLSYRLFQRAEHFSWQALTPLYIRRSEAEEKLNLFNS